MCAAAAADGDAVSLREKAKRLALLAEKAELEAESLEMQAQEARPPPPPLPKISEAASDEEPVVLSSPLRWIGPYPAVALSFPALSTPAQKARILQAVGPGGDPSLATGVTTSTGVTLDFVLDTAANTNTINAQVAGPTSQGGLELEQVGSVAGGVGAGGALGGGVTYMLGACELADVPKAQRLVFMSGLTATALPVAAPAAAGLLGVAFLNSFKGGVEFVWGGGDRGADEEEARAPSLNLYGDAVGTAKLQAALHSVAVRTLPGSALPCVTLSVNGVEIPALLDTGSPVTVLNAAAANKAVGVSDAPPAPADVSSNPLSMLKQAWQAGMAATRAETLTVGGANGPVQLVRVTEPLTLSLSDAVFGEGEGVRPYVGELPGLAALDGLGASAGPAAVLGTDVLRTRPRMWYTPGQLFL
jgi:hypothetical protein